jgi:hypothetical protein
MNHLANLVADAYGGSKPSRELSPQGVFVSLSVLDFASRELPVSCKMASLWAPRDEELSVFPDQACGHMKVGFRHWWILALSS